MLLEPNNPSQFNRTVTDKCESQIFSGDNKELQEVPESSDSLSYQIQQSSQELKSRILDEVVRNLGIHRKAAIRMLRRPWPPRSQQGFKGGRKKKYTQQAKEQLALLWHRMGYMCSERMKAALPEWLTYYEHKH